MVRSLCGRARCLVSAAAALIQSSSPKDGSLRKSVPFYGGLSRVGLAQFQVGKTQSKSLPPPRSYGFPMGGTNLVPRWKASSDRIQQGKEQERRGDLFNEMKQRFLSFKRHKYLKELEKFQILAEAQSPKFMVIACADSRVCPSNILGFQPGEAFMIRNVANLVPPLQNGPTETNSALEFAVNTLQVEDIMVIGHSNCGGIEALMGMQNDIETPSLVEKWVMNGKAAKLRTQAVASHIGFDQQCRYCEKESINESMMHLLTYPWIEERVRRGMLSIHGGYYDLSTCTFEKWKLYSNVSGNRCFVSDTQLWC